MKLILSYLDSNDPIEKGFMWFGAAMLAFFLALDATAFGLFLDTIGPRIEATATITGATQTEPPMQQPTYWHDGIHKIAFILPDGKTGEILVSNAIYQSARVGDKFKVKYYVGPFSRKVVFVGQRRPNELWN